MKFINKYIVFLLIVIGANSVNAQEECTMHAEYSKYTESKRKIKEEIKKDLQLKSGTVTNIPIAFHIIRDDNGNGGLTVADVNTALNQLNTAYQPVDFVFDLCTINEINNSNYHDGITKSYTAGSEEYQMAADSVALVINVFFVPNISGCGWASFPYHQDDDKNWIVVDTSCAKNGSTLAHEVGHYFDLIHTHEIWSSGTGHEIPNTDGTSSNAGDYIGDELSDTNPDPNLRDNVAGYDSSTGTVSCDYEPDTYNTDSNGNSYVAPTYDLDDYVPDTHNFMSYSYTVNFSNGTSETCRDYFSPQQIARMQASYQADRSYLLGHCPCEDSYDLTSHINKDTTFQANDYITSSQNIQAGKIVTFDAGNYILFAPNAAGKGLNPGTGVVICAVIDGCGGEYRQAGSTTNGAVANKPYNPSFKSNDTYSDLNSDKVTNYPNPFASTTLINYTLETNSNVSVSVFDISGKEVARLVDNVELPAGIYQERFDGSNLDGGVYFYTVQTDEYTITKKMVMHK